MNNSVVTEWLNSVFASFDYSLLKPLNSFAQKSDGILTKSIEIFSLLSDKGLFLLLIGTVLFFIKKTRKIGFCLAGGICCSAFFTLILKDLIARPRPFTYYTSIYYKWWQFIGAPLESGFAFPSGHTTVAMAAATAIFLTTNKKISWISFLFVILTGLSRCYLMLHYPSDIIGGVLIGWLGTILVYLVSPLFLQQNLWRYIHEFKKK